MAELESEEREQAHSAPTQEREWVTGVKLVIIMLAISLVCLLVLPDVSIVVTVQTTSMPLCLSSRSLHRPFPELRVTFILCLTWAGMVVHTSWQGTPLRLTLLCRDGG